jgi:Sec-independent protein secretion pathway component TatC
VTLKSRLNNFAILKRRPELSLLQRWLWWESRRPLFNLMVGVAGILGSAVLLGTTAFIEFVLKKETILPDSPLFLILSVFLYGIGANLAYCLGFLAEWVVKAMRDEKTATTYAEISLFLGLLFSVVLTFGIPVLISAFGLGIRLIGITTN